MPGRVVKPEQMTGCCTTRHEREREWCFGVGVLARRRRARWHHRRVGVSSQRSQSWGVAAAALWGLGALRVGGKEGTGKGEKTGFSCACVFWGGGGGGVRGPRVVTAVIDLLKALPQEWDRLLGTVVHDSGHQRLHAAERRNVGVRSGRGRAGRGRIGCQRLCRLPGEGGRGRVDGKRKGWWREVGVDVAHSCGVSVGGRDKKQEPRVRRVQRVE